MILRGASAIYGAAAAWRRRWHAREPSRRKRLRHPVISVGNLSTGGRGKTPVVTTLCRWLQMEGERPAILSRGYGRRRGSRGVTVVADASRVLADVESAGDEPLMLARAVPGVPVLVAADRHAAGVEAEARFDVTVHVLDDGFQHVSLARDIDLLLVASGDLDDRVLPAGRLREPVGAVRLASALLVPVGDEHLRARLRAITPDTPLFDVRRSIGAPVWLNGEPAEGTGVRPPVFAVAAIARPKRFFDDLVREGWQVAGSRSFRDHHWFTPTELAAVEQAARRAGALAIVTTEKDAVRLECLSLNLPVARIPLTAAIEPAAAFHAWLRERLAAARRR